MGSDVRYRVGSTLCYAEFSFEAEYREYLLRNHPWFLAREYPQVARPPWRCRHGWHAWDTRTELEGSGVSVGARVCTRCRAVETLWDGVWSVPSE